MKPLTIPPSLSLKIIALTMPTAAILKSKYIIPVLLVATSPRPVLIDFTSLLSGVVFIVDVPVLSLPLLVLLLSDG
jgi:hypothetical protein